LQNPIKIVFVVLQVSYLSHSIFELPKKALEMKDQVEKFFNERVLPNNRLWNEQAHTVSSGYREGTKCRGQRSWFVEYGAAEANWR